MAMTPSDPRSDRPPGGPKATLICQDCGRERHVDGGWRRRSDGDRVEIVCPACGNVLTRRPSENAAAPDGGRERTLRPPRP